MRLIYFSPVPWDSYEQRPHYYVRHFLETRGPEVVWVDPHPARLPELGDLARLARLRRASALWLARPAGLTVYSPGGWPIDPLPGGAFLNRRFVWRTVMARLASSATRDTIVGFGRPSTLGLAALDRVPHRWSFYDAMDMFPDFYRGLSRRHTARVEREVARRVTRVFASSTRLAQKFEAMGRPVTLMRNAYDMSLLPALAPSPPASGLGFLGCIGRWFDWPLVVRVARVVHPLSVTLVGPRPVRGPAQLPDNVTWQGERHQPDVVPFLSRFAVGLIPFTRVALTSGVDPIKYYQYRGAGLPVLSTRFGEMTTRTDRDDTFFFDDAAGLETAIERALACRPSIAATEAFRLANTWTARFAAARALEPL